MEYEKDSYDCKRMALAKLYYTYYYIIKSEANAIKMHARLQKQKDKIKSKQI